MNKMNNLQLLTAMVSLSLVNFDHFPPVRSFERYEPENPERDTEALRKAQEKRNRKAAKRLVNNNPERVGLI